jgi:hypothetical protein
VRVRLTEHFRREQAADAITEEELVRAWTRPERDLPSREHPGARVRTGTQPGGSRVTVVGHQKQGLLLLITTWRKT